MKLVYILLNLKKNKLIMKINQSEIIEDFKEILSTTNIEKFSISDLHKDFLDIMKKYNIKELEPSDYGNYTTTKEWWFFQQFFCNYISCVQFSTNTLQFLCQEIPLELKYTAKVEDKLYKIIYDEKDKKDCVYLNNTGFTIEQAYLEIEKIKKNFPERFNFYTKIIK